MNAFEDACEELGKNMPRKPSREEVLQSQIKSLEKERDALIEQVKQLKKQNEAAKKRNDQLQQFLSERTAATTKLLTRTARDPYANRSMHSSR